MKRCISMLLVLVMVFSAIPVPSSAAEPQVAPEVDPGDMTIEGTNGFGNLLSEAITKEQEADAEAESEYEAGYTVTDLEIEGNVATVTYDSMEEAILVVALYTEDGMQMLASGKTTVSPDTEKTTVTIEGTMPEYFMASAYLVDTYDLSPLCAAYDTPMYTKDMQELLASTVNDYDPDRVLNLDESEETNFAVYAETTKVIEYVEGKNVVASVNDETSTYVIENADEQFTSLREGDVFVYVYGENEILVAKVGAISVNGTTVTIIGAELEMTDAFSHVKISDNGETENFEFDETRTPEGVTLEGVFSEGEDPGALMPTDSGSASYKKYAKFKLDRTLDETKPGAVEGEMKLTGTLNLSMGVSLEYYSALTKRHYELRLFAEVEIDVSIDAEVKLTLPLVPAKYSNLAVEIGFEPEFIVEVGAEVSFKVTFVAEAVLTFGSKPFDIRVKGGYDSMELSIEGTLFVGIDLNPVVEVAKGYLADLDVSIPLGLSIKGTLGGSKYEYQSEDAATRHECEKCLDIDVSFIVEYKTKFQFLKSKWLKWEIGGKFTLKSKSHYLSLDHDAFGVGECPYKSYRVVIGVKLLDYLPDIVVSASADNGKMTELGVTDKTGMLAVYLPAAKYKFVAEVGDSYLAKTQKIKESCKILLDNSAISDGRVFHEGIVDSEEIKDDTPVIIDAGECGDKVTWSLNDNGVLTISGTGPMWDYPDSDDNAPWYSNCDSITSVIIKNGVTTIGAYAFWYCEKLNSVKIPNSVKTIGECAFYHCRDMGDGLTSVTIPDSVTTIGDFAFARCDLTSVKIGASVTTIGDHAFENCLCLTNVTIPANVTTIGLGAFSSCIDLTDIVFQGNAPSFSPLVFENVTATAYYPAGNATWTATVMKGYGGTITWVPYKIFPNNAASVTVTTEFAETDMPIASDEEPVFQNGLKVPHQDFGDRDETVNPDAVFGGDYSTVVVDTYTLKTASFSGLVPGEQYVLLAMVSLDVDDPLAANNLLYIDQAAALEDGTLVFQYVQRVATDTSYVVACGASNKNLKDAEITFPEMVTNGEMQVVNPTVVYDGKTLTEGQDYTIQGAVSFSEAGTYTCYIRGIRNYAGLVECTYTVISPYHEVASGSCGRNLTWTFYDNGRLTISGTGPMTEFSSYASVPWNDRRSSIVTVIIEDGVTTIGDMAFAECTNLTSVMIGDSVSAIGDLVFSECANLTSVVIPDSVTSIGSYVFRDCSSLKSVTIGDGLTAISACAFQYCNGLTDITIGKSVTSIGYGAFQSCTSLKSVTIPNSVITIDNAAFQFCTSLSSVAIPDGVTTIGNLAFYSCSSLTNVTLPDSVTTIGDDAFSWCDSLTSINVDKNNPSYSSDDRGVLFDEEKTVLIQAPGGISGTYEIPDSVTAIDDSAFISCINLTSVIIPDGVTTIGDDAFSRCSSLTSVTIPDSVTTIDDSAFRFCTSLTSVIIPGSVNTVGPYAFYSCDCLRQITFIGDAPDISEEAFYDVTATAYYPINNPTWIEGVRQNYGGTITWISYCVEHSYEAVVTVPTCIEQGCTTYTCSKCGDSYVADETKPLGHDYETVVTKPACTEQGYTTYTCSKCGDSYVADEMEALGHTYESVVGEYGEVTYTCITCGDSYTEAAPAKFEYVVYEDYVEITGYTGSETEFAIPSEIEGLPVTRIGNRFMEDCSSLTSISIPDTVTSIGWNAFWYCTSLTSISIPGSVTSIGVSAFWGCSSLTSISIPDSVTSIGDSAFYECGSLTGIHVDKNNLNYSSDDRGVLFNKEKTHLIQAPGGIMNSYTVPDCVTYIYDSAFAYCDSLINVDIPDSVTSISSHAFSYCTNLTNIDISGSVTSIDSGAFYGCSSLTTISIPANVYSIDDYAFTDCSSLASIYFNGDAPMFGKDVFRGVTGTAYYHACNTTWTNEAMQSYGGTITWVPDGNDEHNYVDGACIRCDAKDPDWLGGTCGEKVSWTLDGGVLTISGSGPMEDYSSSDYVGWFDSRSLITSVIVENGVISIGNFAFQDCVNMSSVLLPDSITAIGKSAFSGCSSLNGVVIPNSITAIGNSAFYNCDGLISVAIPDSVISIGSSAFYDCDGLTNVTIGNSVKTIANYTFSDCSNLNSVTIGRSVTTINRGAFQYCKSLSSVTIPDSVTAIGDYAFDSCTSLGSVTISDSVTTIGCSAFYNCDSLIKITIPDSVTTIGGSAFYDCDNLSSVTIGDSVTAIGDSAFHVCENLNEIIFKGNVPNLGSSVFKYVIATAYYPANNPTWTKDVFQNYGGTITYTPYYPVIEEGTNTEVEFGEEAEIHINADPTTLVVVYMDGERVDISNYTVTKGSTIITFTAEYLATLSEGIHQVTVKFHSGVANAILTVAASGCTPGDLDLDGDVDAYDLTALARHVGGIEYVTGLALLNADVDGDGDVDAYDLTKHARFVGGIITDWEQT